MQGCFDSGSMLVHYCTTSSWFHYLMDFEASRSTVMQGKHCNEPHGYAHWGRADGEQRPDQSRLHPAARARHDHSAQW